LGVSNAPDDLARAAESNYDHCDGKATETTVDYCFATVENGVLATIPEIGHSEDCSASDVGFADSMRDELVSRGSVSATSKASVEDGETRMSFTLAHQQSELQQSQQQQRRSPTNQADHPLHRHGICSPLGPPNASNNNARASKNSSDHCYSTATETTVDYCFATAENGVLATIPTVEHSEDGGASDVGFADCARDDPAIRGSVGGTRDVAVNDGGARASFLLALEQNGVQQRRQQRRRPAGPGAVARSFDPDQQQRRVSEGRSLPALSSATSLGRRDDVDVDADGDDSGSSGSVSDVAGGGDTTNVQSAMAATKAKVLAARANTNFRSRYQGASPATMFDLEGTSKQSLGADVTGIAP
jgi:hypothetical protein